MAKNTFRQARVRRTGEKVWRHSRLAGYCEGAFWRPFNKADGRRLLHGAELYERHTRKPGAPAGALGYVALEVLRELVRLVDWRTGRLDPSIETLMARCKRSKAPVVRALKALKLAGFLDWIRRYVATGREGFGPQVQQTSNAYRLTLPKAAERLLGLWGKAPPVSADLAAGAAERTRQNNEFMAQASGLADALSRLGVGIAQRESTRRNESPTRSLFDGADDKMSGAAPGARPV